MPFNECISFLDVSEAKDSTVEVKVEFEGQKSKFVESTQTEVMALIATVKIMCHAKVNDVRVNICTPRPIVCSRESVMIGDIGELSNEILMCSSRVSFD